MHHSLCVCAVHPSRWQNTIGKIIDYPNRSIVRSPLSVCVTRISTTCSSLLFSRLEHTWTANSIESKPIDFFPTEIIKFKNINLKSEYFCAETHLCANKKKIPSSFSSSIRLSIISWYVAIESMWRKFEIHYRDMAYCLLCYHFAWAETVRFFFLISTLG